MLVEVRVSYLESSTNLYDSIPLHQTKLMFMIKSKNKILVVIAELNMIKLEL